MERHETKARVEAQIDAWKGTLDAMREKAEVATGQAQVDLHEKTAELQKQFDELKIRTAKAWDVADDSWDSTRKDLETVWADWELRAKKAWSELVK